MNIPAYEQTMQTLQRARIEAMNACNDIGYTILSHATSYINAQAKEEVSAEVLP